MSSMRVMGFDPGLTTGWFIGDVDVINKTINPVAFDEMQEHGGMALNFADYIRYHNVDILVMENIVTHGAIDAAKVVQIAAWTHVRIAASMTGKKLVIVSPEERKRTSFISKSGVPAVLGHARDAAKLVHVFYHRQCAS